MSKTIFVLLDGCTYEGAKENLGYLEHLIESEKGIKLKIKGELPSMSRPMYETLLWDFNALGYKDQITSNNPKMNFEVHIPKEASISAGYATIINAYAKQPYAAALSRDYILSDEGQINLAKGFAKPIRENVVLPEEVKAKMIDNSEYANTRTVQDTKAWEESTKNIGSDWQENVLFYAK